VAALRERIEPPTDRDDGPALPDEALARRAQRDPEAFGEIYRRYGGEIERFFLSRVNGNPEIAQDLTSQVFTRALAALPRYTDGSLRGWLYQIARNLLIDSHRRQQPASSLDGAEVAGSGEPALDDQVIAEEARIQLHTALDALGEPQRSILLLRLQGHTGPEIAERLGISHEAMKSAQYRAMAKLRVALQHLHQRDEP
jgi:RNA polymerase sigma-70 factor (ECF subfamily)